MKTTIVLATATAIAATLILASMAAIMTPVFAGHTGQGNDLPRGCFEGDKVGGGEGIPDKCTGTTHQEDEPGDEQGD